MVNHTFNKQTLIKTLETEAQLSFLVGDFSGKTELVIGLQFSNFGTSGFAAFLGLELKHSQVLNVISSWNKTLSLWSTGPRLCS